MKLPNRYQPPSELRFFAVVSYTNLLPPKLIHRAAGGTTCDGEDPWCDEARYCLSSKSPILNRSMCLLHVCPMDDGACHSHKFVLHLIIYQEWRDYYARIHVNCSKTSGQLPCARHSMHGSHERIPPYCKRCRVMS